MDEGRSLESIDEILPEGSERGRLRLLIERDGLERAVAWAARTAAIYRGAILDRGDRNRPPHHARAPEYRRKYLESYLCFKRFIRLASSRRAEHG